MARTLCWMYALGEAGLPAMVEAGGVAYSLERTVKHDFWAATGFYRSAEGSRTVVKINRQLSALGLPLRWIGRRLKRREVRAYAKLQDLPNVPRLLGDATDTGFVHAYVEGDPLRKGDAVPDGFFAELMGVVDELAARGLAYVDMNKPENIILGADGRPHLIDFQISFDAAAWPGPIGRWLLGVQHRADRYHVLKQKRRFRPDQLSAAEEASLEKRGMAIKLHRVVIRPFKAVRRPVMRWLKRSGRVGETGSN